MIGKQLAHYEIVHQLGKGGMGEVYQARDTKLGRDVALKLLPREVGSDPERLARFRREAKLLAALNHPNIGALYGLEESEGTVFLVMELAEGEDLSQRLRRGPLPVGEALAVALQITEGLEAAHAKGIVHRDLKPANVMYSPSGRIKLLDFGLARAYQGDEASGDPMMSPTITAAMTQQGMVLGTAAYMSPEQARGKNVDRQSDIWAFGVLLYEMLTTHRLFEGETISDSIGAILHKDPEWARLPADTPPQIRQLLDRCLERDREARLHDIADARVAIVEAQRDPTGSRLGLSGGTVEGSRGPRTGLLVAAIAVIGLAAGLGLGRLLREAPEPEPYRIYDVGVSFEPSANQSDGIQAALSPDGGAVVYAHDDRLWVQELSELEPRALDQSEGGFAPFWSPGGTEIGFFQGNRLWKVPAHGGRPVALCELSGRVAGGVGACWTADGRILFALGSTGVLSVSELGGQVRELVPAGEGFGDLHEPFALPDGRGVVFVSHPEDRGPNTLELWRDGERKALFEAGSGDRLWSPSYDRAGYLLFRWTRGQATEGLWALGFDADRGEVRGEPFLVEPDASEASVARDGTLLYVMNPRRSTDRVVVRVGLGGGIQETLSADHAGPMSFALSPDGRQLAFVAFSLDGSENPQLWVRDLARGAESQLTNLDDRFVVNAEWSPDGREIYFIAPPIRERTAAPTMRIPSDGSRPPSVAFDNPGFLTPDGKYFMSITLARGEPLRSASADTTEIWLAPFDDPDAGQVVLGGDGPYFPAPVSPDGDYFLYMRGRAGTFSLYLTRFPEFTGRWKVSLDGNVTAADFAPDGSAIYYLVGEQIFRVELEAGDVPTLGRPEVVGKLPASAEPGLEMHPDGESYLVTVGEGTGEKESGRKGLKIALNWRAKIASR